LEPVRVALDAGVVVKAGPQYSGFYCSDHVSSGLREWRVLREWGGVPHCDRGGLAGQCRFASAGTEDQALEQ
jgi:hypothetical protein